MLLYYKKLWFTLMILLSTLITISSNNWLGMWIGLELNLMSYIPLISKSKTKSISQAKMIYFLTQSIGSITHYPICYFIKYSDCNFPHYNQIWYLNISNNWIISKISYCSIPHVIPSNNQ